MTHTVEIKITITDKQIEEIMNSALVGCTYWADDAEIVVAEGKKKPDLYVSEGITHGYAISIHDAEEDKWMTMGLQEFLKALSKTPTFDYQDYDQEDAEQLLQTALFGEAIYG